MIQDNLQPDIWHEEPTWNNKLGKKEIYFPDKKGKLLKDGGEDNDKLSFTDQGGKVFKEAKISEGKWQYDFISGEEKWLDQQLRFVTDEFIHTVTLVGRPRLR